MADEEVEELLMVYSRRNLDEIAIGVGLDPIVYPNKRAVAKAIVMSRKAKEKVEVEKMEVKKMEVKKMEKLLKGSVKDKINATKHQAKVNVEAVAKINAGILKLTNETNQLRNENKQYIKDFYG